MDKAPKKVTPGTSQGKKKGHNVSVKKQVAQYLAEDWCWVDVPEADPHCRVKVNNGDPAVLVHVFEDGSMEWEEGKDVVVDTTFQGR